MAKKYSDRIHIAYGFNYDVTMITVSMSDEKLRELKETHHTSWGKWHLEWMPSKWFRVYDWRLKVGIRIFDGMTFFQTTFVNACEMVLGADDGRLERVRVGKAGRSHFDYSEMDTIRDYMFTELSLSDSLFKRLRENFLTACIRIRGWYGPGAVASALLTREGIKHDINRVLNPIVYDGSQRAYFGGRFESYYCGRLAGPIYSYDIRSAYPHALRKLPSLNRGIFLPYTKGGPLHDFALYYVQYSFKGPDSAKLGFPHPFPFRDRQNRVFYPPFVIGWYWGVEVKAAMEVHDVEILDGWVFVEDDSHHRPFAFINELYEQRAEWKRLPDKNGAQLAAKLGLNSLYGKLAQRVGWDQKTNLPPRWHQLEYAGYVTATCRAMLYRAMMQSPANIVAVETDGIYSRVPLDLPLGEHLGEWEEEIYDEIVYVQSGVYWTVKNGIVNKAKVRGFGVGSFSYDDAMRALPTLTPLAGNTHRFGALSGFIGRPQLRTWMDTERVAQWGGGGKRAHSKALCHRCNGNPLSETHNLIITNFRGGESYPHHLPWKAAEGVSNDYQEAQDDERYAILRV